MSLKLSRTLCASAVLLATSLSVFAASPDKAVAASPASSVAAHKSDVLNVKETEQVAFRVSVLKRVPHGKDEARSLEFEGRLVTAFGHPVSYFGGEVISYPVSVTTVQKDATSRETEAAAQAVDAALDDAFGDKVQAGSAEQLDSGSAFSTAAQAAADCDGVSDEKLADMGGGSDIATTVDTAQVGTRIVVTPLSKNKDGSINAQVDYHQSALQASLINIVNDAGSTLLLPQTTTQFAQETVRLVPGKSTTIPLQGVDLEIKATILKGDDK